MLELNYNCEISIVIPVYNGEKYLSDCINSILKQTFEDFELIIIDDGSIDNTADIIQQFKNQDYRIRFIRQTNRGQGHARNRGLKLASADYVCFIDADDTLSSNFLSELYNDITKYNADIAISNWEYYTKDSNLYRKNLNPFKKYEILSGKKVEDILSEKIYFTVNKLYRKDFLNTNQIAYGEGFIYEDFQFFVTSFTKAKKVVINPKFLYYVRLNSQSVTKTNHNTRLHYEGFLKAIENSLEHTNFRSQHGAFYVYRYFLNRMQLYSQKRMPKTYSRDFNKDVFRVLNKYKFELNFPDNTSLSTKIIMKKILPKSQVSLFLIHRKISSNKYARKILRHSKKIFRR